MEKLEDRIETLYNLGLLSYSYPQLSSVYELMVTGYAIENNLPRKFVTDSLYYMYKEGGKKPQYGDG